MTSLCLSCFLTGRINCLIEHFLMTGCRNFFLSFYNFVAYSATDSCGLSCFLTSRCYRFINHLCMTQGRDFFCFVFLAFCAGVTLLTFLCTSRITKDFSLFPVMTCCWNYFLEFKDLSADRTVFSFGFSIFGTILLYSLIYYFCMAGCRNFLFIRKNFMAGATIYYRVSCFFAGCCFSHQLYVHMIQCRNLFLCF